MIIRVISDQADESASQSFTDFLKGLHEPYDSIKRQAWNAYPISPVGAENYTIVSIPFSETRYKKDGSVNWLKSLNYARCSSFRPVAPYELYW